MEPNTIETLTNARLVRLTRISATREIPDVKLYFVSPDGAIVTMEAMAASIPAYPGRDTIEYEAETMRWNAFIGAKTLEIYRLVDNQGALSIMLPNGDVTAIGKAPEGDRECFQMAAQYL
jgi:hypothetical protein